MSIVPEIEDFYVPVAARGIRSQKTLLGAFCMGKQASLWPVFLLNTLKFREKPSKCTILPFYSLKGPVYGNWSGNRRLISQIWGFCSILKVPVAVERLQKSQNASMGLWKEQIDQFVARLSFERFEIERKTINDRKFVQFHSFICFSSNQKLQDPKS